MHLPIRFRSLGFLAIFILTQLTAFAQLDPTVFWRPWPEDPHWADTVDELLFFNTGETKGSEARTDSWLWDSYGRIKPAKEDATPPFIIAYRVLSVSVDSELNAINGDFWDVGLAAGGRVAQLEGDWDVNVLAGAGSANDNHWRNSDAIYGAALVDLTHPLDASSAVHLGLMYDGNSLLLPDFPIPYAAYTHRIDETLSYTFGLPATTIHYRPFERLLLELEYRYPIDVEARGTVTINQHVLLFTQLTHSTDSFAIEDMNNRRLFYQLDRVSTGVRLITSWIDASLGVGYAFHQEYSSGFDIRRTKDVATVTDELFFSVKVQGTF